MTNHMFAERRSHRQPKDRFRNRSLARPKADQSAARRSTIWNQRTFHFLLGFTLWLLVARPTVAQFRVAAPSEATSAKTRLVANTAPVEGIQRALLPSSDGQIWRQYDIRAYTESRPDTTKPEQAIVDWILRETGTETWFSLGALSANRNQLRVYHTPAIQGIVADIVERFVHGDAGAYEFGVRMITVHSPNWRSWAYQRLRSVSSQTPGVEAWLAAKEDAAVILTELRKRADFREHSSPNMLIQNGHTQHITRMHPVAYVQSVTRRPELFGTPLQTPVMGQVEQGFKLKISPLLSADERTVDAIIKMDTNQVEKLANVPIDLPTTASQRGVNIQVPQTSSWRLHERFRWPVDRVLLISCGVVAAPTPQRGVGLLGGLSGRASRVEALLFLEAKGKTANTGSFRANNTARSNSNRYQGRY